jgi:hypothetical protein
MKNYLNILILLWLPMQLNAIAIKRTSVGALSFRANGQLYTADSTHARGYAVKLSSLAFINGANNNMVIGIEWKGVKGTGIYSIDTREGKAEFTIDHKTFFPRQAGDYLKITVKAAKQQGAFLLLNGTFEGQLQDRNGNKVKIESGSFQTVSL